MVEHHGSLCGIIKQIKYCKNIYLYRMETEFVSIGPCCYTTEYIKNSGLRNHSYPFDYTFTKTQALSYQKSRKKQVQIRMWPYGRKQTHTPTQVMTPTSTPHVNR